MTGMKVGYLVVEASDLARWSHFGREMLGLPEPIHNRDGSIGFRVDEAVQRLIVAPGESDDVAAVGIELADDRLLDRVCIRLSDAGHRVETGDARARRVDRSFAVRDPAGNRIELFVSPERAVEPFVSAHFADGFRAGDLGFGHAVLVHHDLEAMERFWVSELGFGVSERLDTRAGPIRVRGSFLHCNRRHHSIALFDLPSKKRLHHFMLQANALSDVGRAYERAAQLGVPLSLSLGQHPAPDGTFSFYGQTPSGFDFEIGAGGGEIDPLDWRTLKAERTSAWGHMPTLRLKLRTLGALLSR